VVDGRFLIPSEKQMERSDNEPSGKDEQDGKLNAVGSKSHGNGQKRTETERNIAKHSQEEVASHAPRGNVAENTGCKGYEKTKDSNQRYMRPTGQWTRSEEHARKRE
jgi:hypothetical protein